METNGFYQNVFSYVSGSVLKMRLSQRRGWLQGGCWSGAEQQARQHAVVSRFCHCQHRWPHFTLVMWNKTPPLLSARSLGQVWEPSSWWFCSRQLMPGYNSNYQVREKSWPVALSPGTSGSYTWVSVLHIGTARREYMHWRGTWHGGIAQHLWVFRGVHEMKDGCYI